MAKCVVCVMISDSVIDAIIRSIDDKQWFAETIR